LRLCRTHQRCGSAECLPNFVCTCGVMTVVSRKVAQGLSLHAGTGFGSGSQSWQADNAITARRAENLQRYGAAGYRLVVIVLQHLLPDNAYSS
jgi:hypothetical protein